MRIPARKQRVTRAFRALKTRREILVALGLVFLLRWLGSPLLAGDIYSFIDERGVKVFTNAPPRKSSPSPSGEELPNQEQAEAYRPLIQRLAKQHQVDDRLIEAIITVESNFDPEAVSAKNCKGLMQLHPDTARRFGVQDIFNPEENISGGIQYLRFLSELFDRNLEHVLAAYNAGENAVLRYEGIPPYKETQNYVKRIGRLYDFSLWEQSQKPAARVNRQVHRIELPDGRVIFTNTPDAYAHLLN